MNLEFELAYDSISYFSKKRQIRALPGVARAPTTPRNNPQTWAPTQIARLQGKTRQRNIKTNGNVSTKLNLDFELAYDSVFSFSKNGKFACSRGLRGLP